MLLDVVGIVVVVVVVVIAQVGRSSVRFTLNTGIHGARTSARTHNRSARKQQYPISRRDRSQSHGAVFQQQLSLGVVVVANHLKRFHCIDRFHQALHHGILLRQCFLHRSLPCSQSTTQPTNDSTDQTSPHTQTRTCTHAREKTTGNDSTVCPKVASSSYQGAGMQLGVSAAQV